MTSLKARGDPMECAPHRNRNDALHNGLVEQFRCDGLDGGPQLPEISAFDEEFIPG